MIIEHSARTGGPDYDADEDGGVKFYAKIRHIYVSAGTLIPDHQCRDKHRSIMRAIIAIIILLCFVLHLHIHPAQCVSCPFSVRRQKSNPFTVYVHVGGVCYLNSSHSPLPLPTRPA